MSSLWHSLPLDTKWSVPGVEVDGRGWGSLFPSDARGPDCVFEFYSRVCFVRFRGLVLFLCFYEVSFVIVSAPLVFIESI